MNKFVAIAFAVSALVTIAMPAQSQATARVNCSGITRIACEAAIQAINRAPYRGPIRPATEPMACARVVSYKPVPVIWINGTERNFRQAPVIIETGIVYSEPFGLNKEWVVTESCIPRRLIMGVQNVTLCTGLLLEGFHWALTQQELSSMKGNGHFSSYSPFLTDSDREGLSRKQVRALYKARYGV